MAGRAGNFYSAPTVDRTVPPDQSTMNQRFVLSAISACLTLFCATAGAQAIRSERAMSL